MLALTDAAIVAMPVDELTLACLQDIADSNEWNEFNYFNSYSNAARRQALKR